MDLRGMLKPYLTVRHISFLTAYCSIFANNLVTFILLLNYTAYDDSQYIYKCLVLTVDYILSIVFIIGMHKESSICVLLWLIHSVLWTVYNNSIAFYRFTNILLNCRVKEAALYDAWYMSFSCLMLILFTLIFHHYRDLREAELKKQSSNSMRTCNV